MKKKKIYKKALEKITSVGNFSRTELVEILTPAEYRANKRAVEIANGVRELFVEIAATALSGKRTEEK
jgi:hypothetical protein